MDQAATRLALHGAYFGQNFGDILLMRLFNGYLTECCPKVRIVLPGAPEANREAIGAAETGLASLHGCAGLVFGGGGYLGERSHMRLLWSIRNYRLHVLMSHRARRQRIPYAILGVGFGPLSDAWMRRGVVSMCRAARLFAVRDEESADYAAAYGIPREHVIQTADAALSLTAEDVDPRATAAVAQDLQQHRGCRVVGLHLSTPGAHSHQIVPAIRRLLDVVSRHPDYGVVFFNDSPGNPIPRAYQPLLAEYRERIGSRMSIELYQSVDRQLALLSHFDVVMTNKLHVGICASAFGKPVLSIPLHSKIKRLYRQIRLEENCIPPEALPALDMKGKIDEMLSRGRVSIPAEVVERSRMNRDLVKQFVAGLDIPASTGEQT